VLHNVKGQEVPYFETDGKGTIRCLVVTDGKPCDFVGHNSRGAVGHFLTLHDKAHHARLYGAQAQDRKRATRAATIAEKKMREQREALTDAIALLAEATGVVVNSDTSEMEKQINDLLAERRVLKAENDRMVEVIGDLRARLDLLREAMQGL
jgi:hypothetical protein